MYPYLFSSARLGFRNWCTSDLVPFAALNADPEVMAHFPKRLSKKESADFMLRLQKHFLQKGYTYFAAEVIDTKEFIGFIGLAYQDYISEFTPAIDIGWRLKKSAWGKGYATEGASRMLDFAFHSLGIKKIIAVCTADNFASENVMKKIGLGNKKEFLHPKLKEFPAQERCLCYTIEKLIQAK